MTGTAPMIEDYALIGDLHTAALVHRDGSIDWLCLPRFDSPACFAALLGDENAGMWRIAPQSPDAVPHRCYRDDSLVLETEWRTTDGVVRVIDFMPPRGEAPDVVRIVRGVSGRMRMRMQLRLRFDYGHIVPWVRNRDGELSAVAGPDAVWLHAPVPLHGEDMSTVAEFEVSAGQCIPFVLTYQLSHLPAPHFADAVAAEVDTEQYWHEWIRQCRYRGRWAPQVRRALVTLKALTYAPTGGILAAATTSLPEQLGGPRNWDYRYCWLRDATFTLQALLGTGFVDEAHAWREWLVRAVAGDPRKLQIMYGLDGRRRLPESTLDWLAGFAGSAPVRIGNAAAGQFQLDVWGEVLDGLHLTREAGLGATDTAWDIQRALLDYLEGHWRDPDNGLWEMRGPRRHFVHSKALAWAGVDRAVHTVLEQGLDGPVDHWRSLRADIHREICEHGFDADRNTFTQFYGSRGLDAALLLLPRIGFLPWADPRIRGTVDAVARELTVDGFLLRYHPGADNDYSSDAVGVDGLPGGEGAFVACTFWLADALHCLGDTVRAEELFEQLLDVRNDVGLLAEEYDPHAGHQLGNTPQAFSMVGLINTARNLSGSSTATAATGSHQDLHRISLPTSALSP
ncbi:glycoside hydrolase family 15 protein [Rhodococcus chondri]|uniref:Glycoside hydrolase family 15 protein n=1 Tax=Rhodococcus chondri TaxID=3065941 RepID=A0ABU7JX15_9NOCA|nr:glycoside hydrolase family 15 protein [Rhodococcus sp. CC-R104]MEE2034563.1 glycoside hydrolase family 15 protein [Rhodococcus sp. CC-R104]